MMLSLIVALSGIGYSQDYHPYDESYKLANRAITIASGRYHEYPKYSDVLGIAQVSQWLGKECIPGVFSAEDYMSLAFVESQFDPFIIGRDKEVGVWQILDWKKLMFEMKASNPFDIWINGSMACHELREKYKKYPNKKQAIQSYNSAHFNLNHYFYYNKVMKFKKEAWPELIKEEKPKKHELKKKHEKM